MNPPTPPSRFGLTEVALTGGLLAAATLVRFLLDPALGDELPRITFYVAVALIAWRTNTLLAIIGLIGGWTIAELLFNPPRGSITIYTGETEHLTDNIRYFAVGVSVITVAHFLRTAWRDAAESGERLRTTLASIGDGVIATDLKGRVTMMNAVAIELTGWELTDAKGQPLETVFNIVNEDTRKVVENPALRALKQGRIVGLANHTVLIAKDGIERFIDDSAAPIRCADGEIVGSVLIFRDITEQRKAERAAASLAAIVESSDDAIISKDLNATITSWNNGAERMFGYPAQEAIGRSITMLIPPDRQHEEPEILARLRRGEFIDHFDTVRVRKDGSPVDISLTISPIRNSHGQVIGASKIARSVSERKAIESALRASHDELNAIYSNTPVGMALLDRDLRFLRINKQLADINGLSVGDHIGKTIREVLPQLAEQVEAKFRRILETGEPVLNVELTGQTAASPGEERTWLESWFPHRNAVGEIIGINTVVQEITERKRAERALETELADTQLLQRLSTAIAYGQGTQSLYENIIDSAVQIMRSDFASMQMLYPDRGHEGELRLLAFRGFNPEAATFWEWVRADSESTCGMALRTGERSIAPDVEKCDFMAGSDDLATYLQTGIHAVQTTPLFSRSGSLVGMISTHWREPHTPLERELRLLDILARQAADLIERARAEEALSESEARFRAVSESLPQLVWTCSSDGNCDYLCRQWCEYTGIAEEPQLGSGWLEQVHPDDRESLAASWNTSVAEGADLDIEFRIRRHDGEYRWFMTRAAALRNENGEITKWFGTNTDIEDLKQAERELASQKAFSERIVTDSPIAIAVLKAPDLEFVSVNPAYQAIMGPEFEFVGRTYRDVFPEAADRGAEAKLLEVIRTGKQWHVDSFETEMPGRSDLVWWDGECVPLANEYGEIDSVLVQTWDISERKQAEQMVRKRDILENVIKSQEGDRNRIARDLHDHLGQQLTGLRLTLEDLAKSSEAFPDVVAKVEQAKAGALRLDIDVSVMAFELRSTVLKEQGLVKALENFVSEWSRNHQVSAEFQVRDEVAGRRFSDEIETHLYRIVQEALNNALKHARAAKIGVILESSNGRLRLIIEDDGIGFQTAKARKPKKGGMGLRNMRERVELLGGTIEIDSGTGKGTTIFVAVPTD